MLERQFSLQGSEKRPWCSCGDRANNDGLRTGTNPRRRRHRRDHLGRPHTAVLGLNVSQHLRR